MLLDLHVKQTWGATKTHHCLYSSPNARSSKIFVEDLARGRCRGRAVITTKVWPTDTSCMRGDNFYKVRSAGDVAGERKPAPDGSYRSRG